jgi:hypothetical protein
MSLANDNLEFLTVTLSFLNLSFSRIHPALSSSACTSAISMLLPTPLKALARAHTYPGGHAAKF